MRRSVPVVIIAGLTLAACARQTRIESGGDVAVREAPVNARTLPSGTTIDARLEREIGTKTSRVGDGFTATVDNAVLAQNGATVVPAGAKLYGTVTGLHSSERTGDQAAIRIAFERIEFNGQSHPFEAKVTATALETRGQDSRSETLKKAGIGAAAGAVLGGILSGGELDKILIGGALGAAAGTVISLGTGDVEGVLPAGTRMTLQTTRTVALR